MPFASLAPQSAAFYTTQSAFSDPGLLAARYADLPDDPDELARVARDLLVHRLEGEFSGTPSRRIDCTTTPRRVTSTTSCGSSSSATTPR